MQIIVFFVFKNFFLIILTICFALMDSAIDMYIFVENIDQLSPSKVRGVTSQAVPEMDATSSGQMFIRNYSNCISGSSISGMDRGTKQ